MTVKEFAAFHKVSKARVYQKLHSGKLAFTLDENGRVCIAEKTAWVHGVPGRPFRIEENK